MPNQQNDLLQAYIAREPAGPRQRDIAMLKMSIAGCVARKQWKPTIEFIRLLIAAEKSRFQEDRQGGWIVEQSALQAGLATFGAVYVGIVAAAPQSTLFIDRYCRKFAQLQPPESIVFDRSWHSLLTPEFYPAELGEDHLAACFASGPATKPIVAERDFYLGESPDPVYACILASESAGILRELVALAKWHLEDAQNSRDILLIGQWSKLINALYKAQSTLTVQQSELRGVADIQGVGDLLSTLFANSFRADPPDLAEQLGSRLTDAIREQTADPHGEMVAQFVRLWKLATESRRNWHDDASRLVSSFPAAIALAMDGAGRDGLLDAFAGGAERYPLATRSAG